MTQTGIPFTKGQALGNDYIILDSGAAPRPAPELVRLLCDRHFGVGGDGVLYGGSGGFRAEIGAPGADVDEGVVRGGIDGEFQLTIFNPDGREAEKSGNGLRIFGAWLHSRGLVGEEPFHVRIPGERVELRVLGAEDGELSIRVAMGRASFFHEDVHFTGDTRLEVGDGEVVTVQPVSVGNPHAVVWVGALDVEDFRRLAPRISEHPAFVEGVNVQFASVAGPGTIDAFVHERGAGETLASGSSACAIAAAAVRSGRVQPGRIRVRMPGGTLVVDVTEDFVLDLTGQARIVFEGRFLAPVRSGPAS